MDSLKKQTYLHCLCVILCGFFLLTVSTAQAAPRPTLRVGYTGIPGYIARDYQQRYKGVAYEYLEALATYLGVSLEYVPGAFEENLLRLQTGTIDLLPRQDSQNTLSLSPPTLSTPPGIQPVALGPGAGFALLSSQRPELIQNIKASVQDMAAVNPFFLYQFWIGFCPFACLFICFDHSFNHFWAIFAQLLLNTQHAITVKTHITIE